jgi:hypothetical protein
VRKKVETELDATRADIDRLFIPQGKGVVRHLQLPKQGLPLEWILDEMEQMDREGPSQTNYRDGKISGTVYRARIFIMVRTSRAEQYSQTVVTTWKKSSLLLFSGIVSPIHYTRMSFPQSGRWKQKL